eukprot:PRCOL_00004277-RA
MGAGGRGGRAHDARDAPPAPRPPKTTRRDRPHPPLAMPPKAAPVHPTYAVMVRAAVLALKERTGSSNPAIWKYISANYKGVDKKILSTQLKNLVAKGKLVKVKASYKCSEEFKKVRGKRARAMGGAAARAARRGARGATSP